MAHPSSTADHEYVCAADTLDGFRVPVRLSGPDGGRVVIMLDEVPGGQDAYDAVRDRLHVATFRTLTIPAHPDLSPKSVIRILDQFEVDSALLVGDRSGGELAWSLAASQRGRFTGLVVIDCGHPRVPDLDGSVREKDCGPVEVDTTALVSSRTADAVARASRRYVHGEFRLVDLAGPRNSRHFTAQLAAEIVVRALCR
ncbi:alpha/beta hydrolase [Mycobacterium sp. E2327]|uniref:alpha/beta fold hydrolase n=1 Tax=Mycobacterium sp. E2327 TaxID=1834132 RepID=UPI000800E6F8|nr:alpha/beta hydrolase [Mycobacterium sp. E2327]OBI17428.1 alpha/beta hydrolase [Mycobacterium sp. E2327]